jgi:hypothetical protein
MDMIALVLESLCQPPYAVGADRWSYRVELSIEIGF